jgi:hypothetical protein
MHLLYKFNNVAYNTVESQRNKNFYIFLSCVSCGGIWASLAVSREYISAAFMLSKGTRVVEKGEQSAKHKNE